MDLVEVLLEASVRHQNGGVAVSLGNSALDAYYTDLFATMLPGQAGQKLIWASLNFILQQLATRSRADRERERYLQIGSFDAADLAAGLIQAMPQTLVQWVPGFTDITPDSCEAVVETIRARLPADGLAHEVSISGRDWREIGGVFGQITLFADRPVPELARHAAGLRRLLNPSGRVVMFEALSAGQHPTAFADPQFAGRYLASGPVDTIAITVLGATS